MLDVDFITPCCSPKKKRLSASSSTLFSTEFATPRQPQAQKRTLLDRLESGDPRELFDAVMPGRPVIRSKDKDSEAGRPNSAYYRKIYTSWCGVIPDCFEVHHIDMNPQNCEIQNLVAIPSDLHHKLHSIQYAQETIISWMKNPNSYKKCLKRTKQYILSKIEDLPYIFQQYRNCLLSRNKILIERHHLQLSPISDISEIVDSLFVLRSDRTPYGLRLTPKSKKHISRLSMQKPTSPISPLITT
ncbi:MAG: HNH endonuclease [Rickettsiales bacterium]|nr:HNH endonuclease [Rickettsiales bacterium]